MLATAVGTVEMRFAQHFHHVVMHPLFPTEREGFQGTFCVVDEKPASLVLTRERNSLTLARFWALGVLSGLKVLKVLKYFHVVCSGSLQRFLIK